MGGKALKNIIAKRMDNNVYKQMKCEILELLKGHYIRVIVPFEKPGKLDHGDLDVICQLSKDVNRFDPISMSSKEIVRNGHVVSFEYKDHQIDLIQVQTEAEFNFARVFFSYGDCGMILGMICKRVGLLLSDTKLSIYLPEPLSDQKMILTNDIGKVLKFLGLSQDDWDDGFDTEESVFKWIQGCRYFKRDTFSVLNRERKKREKDRPMFRHFLNYCNEVSFPTTSNPDTTDVFNEAVKFFDKETCYSNFVEKKEKEQRIREKFNGKLVMDWTGLKNKDLGCVISRFKMLYSNDALDAQSSREIKENFMEMILHG